MYHINGEIPPIHIGNICSQNCYAIVPHRVFGNPIFSSSVTD